MHRFLTASLAALFVACATVPVSEPATVSGAEPAVASTAPPCNAGHSILSATLWVQSAAEYEAAALGTYGAARLALDAALADPTWVGATEETSEGGSQPPAVILDADETIVDNSMFQARVIRRGQTFDETIWRQWVSEAAATAIPGALEFIAYARSRGVTPFYITNRDHPHETEGTRRNLERLGFIIPGDPENLFMRGARPEWKSDKSSRRAHVAANYRVLLLVGDDLNDFANARDSKHGERAAIVEERANWWGRRWFMLPNPMYGSWERAAASREGTPCEQLQRKVDVLRER
jgi:5'-nucleotidase (lipoprotein e(P4) family)